MITQIGFIKRNPGLTVGEFRDYWFNVHVPLIRSRLPNLRGYRGHLPVAGQRFADVDAIVELSFDDLASLQAAMGSAEFNAPERNASSSRLLDLDSVYAYVVETVDFLQGDDLPGR